MKSLIKLQLVTFFRKPLPYIASFVVFPLLFLLVSSLFSLNAVFIGILMIPIIINIAFVFVPNYVDTRNSILMKRIQLSNISKISYVIITAMICMVWTIGSIYLMLYVIDWSNWLYAVMFTNGEFADSLIPARHTFFFMTDLFSILDDSIWNALFKDGQALHDSLENGRIHQIIVDGLINGDSPNEIADYIFDTIGTSTALQASINLVIDFVFSSVDPGYASYIELEEINHPQERDQIDGLAGLINYYEGNGFSDVSEIAMLRMENNNWHAPINIATYLFLGTSEHENPNAILDYPMQSSPWYKLSDNLIDWRYFEWTNSKIIGYGNPIKELDLSGYAASPGFLMPDGNYSFQGWSNLDRIIAFFFSMCIVTFSVFSISFLVVSISKTYSQYTYLAIVTSFMILVFSGSLFPIAVVFSSPIVYFVANFFPTTNLVLFWQATAVGMNSVPLMSDYSFFGYVVIPLLISSFIFIVGSAFYTMQEGRMTRRFEFSSTGKAWIIITLSAILIFEFFVAGRVIDSFTKMNDGINQHTSNYFLLNFLFLNFGIAMFVFFILYLKGFSSRSKKWTKLMPILTTFMIISLLVYILISNNPTPYSTGTCLLLGTSSILVFIFGFTNKVIVRGKIEF